MGKHKSVDCIPFLGSVNKKRPRQRTLRIVVDDHAAHKTLEIQAYLESKEGRFVEHLISMYSSRQNPVERWFREIATKRIRRGSSSGVPQLEKAIRQF